jgi:hypothetical protein
VHAERLAQERVRGLIWQFYADLKDYQATPSPCRRNHLRARFDYIFGLRTGFATLDRLLQRLHANKTELLAVLERPDIPLHTSGGEVYFWDESGFRADSVHGKT